jgi:nucleoside-diphosphate-sugar epimerase
MLVQRIFCLCNILFYATLLSTALTPGVTDTYFMSTKPLRILVFGGTGFVGSLLVSKALQRGHDVVALSRRGRPKQLVGGTKEARWLQCDVANQKQLFDILQTENKFDVYVHAVGLLFDSSSGLSHLNKFASGSSSVPADSATYDLVTRQTAFNAIDLLSQKHSDLITETSNASLPAMPFVSAGWTFECHVPWLERYLVTKRAVESRLLSSQSSLRPVIFRPSLIWTKKRPQSLLSVLPFFAGNFLLEGLLGMDSIIDKPITVDMLTDAMIYAAEHSDQVGVKR